MENNSIMSEHVVWSNKFVVDVVRAKKRIVHWGEDVLDDDLEIPSSLVIERTKEVLDNLYSIVEHQLSAMTGGILLNFRGVSLGSGGEISIELAGGDFAVTYRVEPSGDIVELTFLDGEMIGYLVFRHEGEPIQQETNDAEVMRAKILDTVSQDRRDEMETRLNAIDEQLKMEAKAEEEHLQKVAKMLKSMYS